MAGRRMILAGALLLAGACARAGTQPPQQPSPDSVSIGYGRQSARNATGAVQSIRPDSNRVQQYATVADMLVGRVAGLEVLQSAGGISLRLRGTSSITGNNEPLLVIDGQMISPDGTSNALLALAPSDIERIDVLKDAGSTAIYGVRGSNGVIEIVTRRGPR